MLYYTCTRAKMAKYHIFWKFLAKKHCFGNKWQTTTFSRTRVPHQFCHRGTAELEFVWLKKNYVVLEIGKLEFHATQYSNIPDSSTFYKKNYVYVYFYGTRAWWARVPCKELEFSKLEFLITFFFLFWDNRQIKHKHKYK